MTKAFKRNYHHIVREIETDIAVKLPLVLREGDFIISNANRETTFSFCIPPLEPPLDLLEKIKENIS